MINRINSTQSPAFGMAFRFKEDGAKRMAEAFKNVPNEARNLTSSKNSSMVSRWYSGKFGALGHCLFSLRMNAFACFASL